MTTPNKVYICTTRTNTPTVSFSKTPTQTITPTQTPTNSRTPSKTPTSTKTPTQTSTLTPTTTPTPSQTSTVTPSQTPTKTPTNTTSNTPTPTNLPILYFTGPKLAEGETTLQFKGKFTFRPTGNQNGPVKWEGDKLEGDGKLLALDDAGRPTTQELDKTYGVINETINIEVQNYGVDQADYEVSVELRWPVKCQPVGILKIPFTVERNIPPVTPSSTRTPTRTSTKTPSPTSSSTPSNTPSSTHTKTPTPSNSPTITKTPTVTSTATITASPTPTKTQTSSITPTPSVTETSYSNCTIISTPYPDPIEYDEMTQGVVVLGSPNINIQPRN